ncbi:MAG: T9SS type A sorting domain-containing protein [Paludibacteraceae bacterium]|nr:T9SS type A sorting domain-containing protein [Paludibacteraceae bacterium]
MKKIVICLASLFVTTCLQATSLIGIRADKSTTVFALDDVMSIKVSESNLMTVNTFNGEKVENFNVLKFDSNITKAENLNSNDIIQVYPNPVKHTLYLVGATESTSISIFDMSGKTVIVGKGESINVESLSKGMYIISAEGKKVKFIKD